VWPASDERQLVHDDDHAASFLSFLRLPPLLEQTPRHADLPSFGEVLGRYLGQLAPEREVEPVGLLPVPSPWHGDGAGRHRRAVLRVAELRSGSESPDQSNRVHADASCSISPPDTTSGTISASLAFRQSSTRAAMRCAADCELRFPAAKAYRASSARRSMSQVLGCPWQ